MRRTRPSHGLALVLGLVLIIAACGGGRDDGDDSSGGNGGDGDQASEVGINTDDCGNDPTQELEGDTITLASSFPQSGITAPFAKIAVGYKSYFNYVNEQGGVDVGGKKYKIEVVDKDDTYEAAVTSANIRELVGRGDDLEKAFAVFSVVGTANNVAIRDSLNDACVPDVFAATGSPAWGNPDFPWLIGGGLVPYTLEGQAFADYLKQEKPDAKVAMLVQGDDFGAAYEEGFKNAIEGTDITVTQVEEYSAGAQDVKAQVTSLAGSGADTFFNGATLLACPNALQSAKAEGWEPVTWVSGTCITKTLMGLADGDESNDGIISLTNLKDPQDPQYDDDEAMNLYREQVVKSFPEDDTDNGAIGYGWTQGALFVEVLKTMESVTRLDLMDAVSTMDEVEAGLLLDGATMTTGKDDKFMAESFAVVQYSTADHFFSRVDPDAPLLDFEGETAELGPTDLINA